jgi:hypothetical protein
MRNRWPIAHNAIFKVDKNHKYLDDASKRRTIEPRVTDYLGCSTGRKVGGRKYGAVVEARGV